jgi:hypothetical protein
MYIVDVPEAVIGLGLAAPGPLAAQLAIVLTWVYLRYGGLAWMQAAFYGIGAALVLLWRAQRIPEPALIVGAGLAGLVLPVCRI